MGSNVYFFIFYLSGDSGNAKNKLLEANQLEMEPEAVHMFQGYQEGELSFQEGGANLVPEVYDMPRQLDRHGLLAAQENKGEVLEVTVKGESLGLDDWI